MSKVWREGGEWWGDNPDGGASVNLSDLYDLENTTPQTALQSERAKLALLQEVVTIVEEEQKEAILLLAEVIHETSRGRTHGTSEAWPSLPFSRQRLLVEQATAMADRVKKLADKL